MLLRSGLLMLGTTLFLAGTLPAQDPAAPPPPRRLTLDLGFVNASGNTDVTTLSAGETLELNAERWEFRQTGSLVYGRTDDSTNAEQLRIGTRVGHILMRYLNVFVGISYERNRFAGIARRWEQYGGLGLRLLNTSQTRWTIEAGASLNQQRATTLASTSFTALRVATLFRHNFTETTALQQQVEVLPNLDNGDDLRVNSETSLVAPLSARVALKVAYTIKFDNLPEPGFEETDRILTTGLQVVW
jgi:putative salt-induced outer membrane protein